MSTIFQLEECGEGPSVPRLEAEILLVPLLCKEYLSVVYLYVLFVYLFFKFRQCKHQP